jgi:hypothetical protein
MIEFNFLTMTFVEVFIPRAVVQDTRLPKAAEVLYGELARRVTAEGYCEVYLPEWAQSFKASVPSVQRGIKNLQDTEYLSVKRYPLRCLRVALKPCTATLRSASYPMIPLKPGNSNS